MALSTLDLSEGPRPSLQRANTTTFFEQRNLQYSPSPRPPSFVDLVAAGVRPSPWTPGHPDYHKLKHKRKTSWQEECHQHQRQKKLKKEEERTRQEVRRLGRQLDGSRSLTPSPSISRINSHVFNPSKRADTGSSLNSVKSAQSSTSSRVSSLLNRVQSAPQPQDDRELQGHEARQERQLRTFEARTDSKSDSTSYRGQGQRRLFGKHKGKGIG